MQFTHITGGEGSSWLAPVLILVIVSSPVLLGLTLRVTDRRTGSKASAPARSKAGRKGFGLQFTLGLVASLGIAFVLAVAGLGIVGVPLALACLVATLLRQGYDPRL